MADTKLARHVKAGAVLQICTYVDLLTAIQGVEPVDLHVVLGGSLAACARCGWRTTWPTTASPAPDSTLP